MNPWILLMLGRVINHHRGLMHIKYTLALCQHRVLMPILAYLLCLFVVHVSDMNSEMFFIFGIVTMYMYL